ncbi:methyltransferase family protein [Mycolicibacterium psychrotolerans]|uniref:Membrane protein n=1 Tax=Mycolicibacterium psychrotolerans TaxID=216929 RepID=A0A7I7MAR0_9MYCO|nr:isoprenylcysteine carboxylmethyltransferase family protein [Mycolicibacterium psychrotolerans]BBX68907.1 membrane protein [Mycolicibacterium psychrotolerans]
MKLAVQIATSLVLGLAFFGLVLFLPAGTFDYWQAWVFVAVFSVSTFVPSMYLAIRHPDALARRMKAGPTAESRPAQRIIITATFLAGIAVMVISALDWRFGWSAVPVWLVIAGDVLVAAGLLGAQLVVVQNNYAGASITVEEDQPLVSTGLYGVVRHPMYALSLIMMLGTPPALGSLWGLTAVVAAVPVLVARLLDEEKALTDDLAGYAEYTRQVPYRLIPGVW